MNNRLTQYVQAHLERYPLLRRLHVRAGARPLWEINRHSVARGVAVGFFFGVLTPVAQIVFAIVAAIALRANVAVAAASTLITNPFILPFVYYYAYQIGYSVTGRGRTLEVDVIVSEEAAGSALDVAEWVPTLIDWATSVGYTLIVGVLLLAFGAALFGYLFVHLAWTLSNAVRNIATR